MNTNEIEEKYLAELRRILKAYLSQYEYEAFIFGSWATGNARPNSDVDIGIIPVNGEFSETSIENLKNALIESSIPYYTDVVDFSKVNEDFKKVALNKIIPLYNVRK